MCHRYSTSHLFTDSCSLGAPI